MEYRKNGCTPREMVDDTLFEHLLRENDPVCGIYGSIRERNTNNGCSCRIKQVHIRPDVSSSCHEDHADMHIEEKCRDNSCAKKNELSGRHLAMSYTPDQEWQNLFEIEEALGHGTIFRELEFPFYPACKSCR